MAEPFLSAEDYDEQAHRLYDAGDYDGALQMLKEGLALYPNAVDLYVGMGYARLAREEYAWARQAFQHARVLDPSHEDALVGLGEALLRFGHAREALRLFREVELLGYDEDVDLLLSMGRALFREQMFDRSRDYFAKALALRPDHAEAAASLGYALHRLGDEVGASRQIRRALRLDPDLHEARVFLGHILYDRGDWEASLREFEAVPPDDHWDPLAVWRTMELKRAVWQMDGGDTRLRPWADRLRELEGTGDEIDHLLAEIEAEVNEALFGADPLDQLDLFPQDDGGPPELHQVRAWDGRVFRGTWAEILRQIRDQAGFSHESLGEYMRRLAERWHQQTGVEIPFSHPSAFFRAADEAGFITLEDEDR